MPRKARKRSNTGIYHIILRGINKQIIFQGNEDREYFIKKMTYYRKKIRFKVYAYCLMDNHIHIIIDEKNEGIDNIVKRISSSYVYYYNKKYERCGHLFQERYKSEPVEEERYFAVLVRYIHQNPVKAGIVKNAFQYRWSSYEEYLNKEKLIDCKFYLEMLDNNEEKARKKYKEFMNEKNKDECLEYDSNVGITDVEAIKEIKNRLGEEIIENINQMSIKEQKEVLKEIKKIKEIGIRQIVRITGISLGIARQ